MCERSWRKLEAIARKKDLISTYRGAFKHFSTESSFHKLVLGHGCIYLCEKAFLIRRPFFAWFNSSFSWMKIIQAKLNIKAMWTKNNLCDEFKCKNEKSFIIDWASKYVPINAPYVIKCCGPGKNVLINLIKIAARARRWLWLWLGGQVSPEGDAPSNGMTSLSASCSATVHIFNFKIWMAKSKDVPTR